MKLKVKHRTEHQPNKASSYQQIVRTREIECDRVREENNITMFEEEASSGSYKAVFIINSKYLITAESQE